MSLLVQDLGLSRRACDRCHGQKLRCKREYNSQACLRCQRAGVQCTSRSLRSRRQARPYATQPAPIQGNHPAQSLGKPYHFNIYAPIKGLTPQKAIPNTEQSSNEVPEELGPSPISLLDLPSDLDLDLDLSAFRSDIGHPFDAHDLESGMDLATMPCHYSSQLFAREQPQVRMGQSEQEHPAGLRSAFHSTSQGSHMSPSSASKFLPPHREAPSNHSRCRSSLGMNMTPKSQDGQSQDENNALTAFDQQEGGTALNPDTENSGTDPCHKQLVSTRPPSAHCDVQSPYNREQQITKPIVDPVLASWIRKLSNFSVELHLHMLSIPPVQAQSNSSTDSAGKVPDSTHHNQEIAVDSTIQLSNQYMDILQDILSQFKTRQAHTGSTTAVGALDQPSQLLILSGYLCLAESYDKIVQHIKTWTEVRSKMGGSTSIEHHFPIQLPTLAIGSFKLSTSSPSRPLVLTCIIEAMIMQVRDLISEMTKPIHSRNGTTKVSDSPIGEQGTVSGDGLSGVAKITLQAIRAKEDSIMKLIHRVCRLALRCGGP